MKELEAKTIKQVTFCTWAVGNGQFETHWDAGRLWYRSIRTQAGQWRQVASRARSPLEPDSGVCLALLKAEADVCPRGLRDKVRRWYTEAKAIHEVHEEHEAKRRAADPDGTVEAGAREIAEGGPPTSRAALDEARHLLTQANAVSPHSECEQYLIAAGHSLVWAVKLVRAELEDTKRAPGLQPRDL